MADRDDAHSFLTAHRAGVLSTVSPDGTPRGRLVYYAADEKFNIYFMTLANTRKVADLAAHPFASFTVAAGAIPQTLQLEGAVVDITETATIDDALADLTKNLFSNAPYYAPLNRFDSAAVKYYRLSPHWIRWGDFSTGVGSDEVFTTLRPE